MAAKSDTLEVVAVRVLHDHSDPAFPKVTLPGEKATFPRKEAQDLIARGDALAVKDVPKDADPAELTVLANTVESARP